MILELKKFDVMLFKIIVLKIFVYLNIWLI